MGDPARPRTPDDDFLARLDPDCDGDFETSKRLRMRAWGICGHPPAIECGCSVRTAWDRLTDRLRGNPDITHLEIEAATPLPHHVGYLADFIRGTRTLEYFSLRYADVEYVAAYDIWREFGDAFGQNRTLKTIRFDGILSLIILSRFLMPALAHTSTLHTLVLRAGSVNMYHIAGFLESNKTLQHLDLSFTGLTSDDLSRLTAALAVNRTLRGLDLTGIQLGYRDIREIVKLIETNTTLYTLIMNYASPMNQGIRNQLCKALMHNTTLVYVEFPRVSSPRSPDPWLARRQAYLEARWNTLLLFKHWWTTNQLLGYERDFVRYHLFPELCQVPLKLDR